MANNTERYEMGNNANLTWRACAGGAVVAVGVVLSEVVAEALTGQPSWLRITARAVAAGLIGGTFMLVANPFRRG